MKYINITAEDRRQIKIGWYMAEKERMKPWKEKGYWDCQGIEVKARCHPTNS